MQTRRLMTCALSLAVFAVTTGIAKDQNGAADHSTWGKYIITEMPLPSKVDAAGQAAENATLGEKVQGMIRNMRSLNDKVVKGSYYTDVSWIMKANPGKAWVTEHSHPFGEILGFFGSDPEHPDELNAVIEFSIGGEKHVLTKSSLIFVPKHVKHCPLVIEKVDRPVLFFTTGPSASYDATK